MTLKTDLRFGFALLRFVCALCELQAGDGIDAMSLTMPYTKAAIPNPTNVGEENVIAMAERMLRHE